MSNVSQIIASLNTNYDVELGKGPDHPIQPDHSLDKEIEDFFALFPSLKEDDAYYVFQRTYAGAIFINDYFEISIYGFDSHVALHLLYDSGQIIDSDDFVLIADITLVDISNGNESYTSFGFAYNSKSNTQIFRKINNSGYTFFCNSFIDFLELLSSDYNSFIKN